MPRPVQQPLKAAAAAGAEDQLGGVLRAGEVQQRGGHVVADDRVVAAAEALHELPLPGQRGGDAPAASPSLRATCTASRSPPADRSAIRAARRISVSPSGPPVSATTTRSLVSHTPPMPCSLRYCCSASSTRPATHSSASSRSAVRLPIRK